MSLQAVVQLVDNMSAPLRNLTGLLGEFAKGVAEGARAEAELIRKTNEAGKSQESLKDKVSGVAKAIAGLVAVQQTFQAFAAVTASAEAFDDLAEKTGIAASKLEAYSFAAKMSGTSIEAITGGLNRLGRSIGMSAEETSKQAAAFEALGISTKDANGNLKSSEEIFGEVADKFREFEDTPEKTAIGLAIFGQRFNELNPLLSRGSEGIRELRDEAEQLRGMGGASFDAFAASAGALFDGIDKLRQIFTGFLSTIAAELVPVMNLVIESFINSYKSGGLFAQVLEGIKVVLIGAFIPAMKGTIQVLRGFADIVEIAGKGLGALGAMIASVASGNLEGAREVYRAYKEDVQNISAAHVEFTDKLWSASNASDMVSAALEGTDLKLKKIAPSMKSAGEATKAVKSSLQELVSQLKIANESFNLDESIKQRLEAERKYAADVAAGINVDVARRLLDEANAQIERNRTLREGAKEAEAYAKAGKTVEEYNAETALLEYEATLVGKSTAERARLIEKFKEEESLRLSLIGLTEEHSSKIKEDTAAAQARRDAALQSSEAARIENEILSQSAAVLEADVQARIMSATRLLEAGKITTEDYTKYVEGQLKKIRDTTEKTTDEMTLFWQEAAKGMQSAISSFFFDIMQGKFDDLGSRFKALLDRMVADALAANLAAALFGGDFTKGGSMGGIFGNIASGIGSLFGGGKAAGGPVSGGSMYMVGELGPELFVPGVSGTIIPNSSISFGSPVPVNINITAMDSQDVRRALEKDNRWIADMVNKTSRTYNLGV